MVRDANNFTGMTHALAEITKDSVLQSSCLLQWLCEINSLWRDEQACLQTGMK